MADDKALDQLLRDFLAREASERELGHTKEAIIGSIARVADAQSTHENNDIIRFAGVTSRLDQHEFRIGSVESVAAKVQAKADQLATDTGNHRIVVAEAKVERLSSVLWKIGLAIGGFLGSGTLGYLARYFHLFGGSQ